MTPKLAWLKAAGAFLAALAAVPAGPYAVQGGEATVILKTSESKPICRYVHGELPADEPQTAVPVVGYLHPIYTPAGEVLTESTGGDHAWLRGVFVAWPQVKGRKDGGFWTCGKAVWKEPGRIVNRKLRTAVSADGATISAVNAWVADGVDVVMEAADITATARDGVHVIDWRVTMSSPDGSDVTLRPWPFSGLTFHGRRVGGEGVTIHDPGGEVKRGNAPWNNPKGNWPDAAWYDLALTAKDGKACGLAILGHPGNGKAGAGALEELPAGDGKQTWNITRGLRFLAPTVTAANPFVIKKGRPLVLRYRIVAHDGPPPADLLNKLAKELAGEKPDAAEKKP